MDDLSGLDWSKPTGSQSKPSMAMPMNPSYPSLSVRHTPSPADSGRSTPASIGRGMAAPTAKPQPAKPSQDSFSNLMNFASQPKPTQNLSLAERQAQLEAEKRKREDEKRKQAEAQFGNGQQWDALGSRTYSASPSLQPPTVPPPRDDDDSLFAAFNKDTKVDASSHYPPPEPHRSIAADEKKLNLSDPSAWNKPASGSLTGGGFDDDDDPFGLSQMKTQAKNGHIAPTTAAAAEDDDFLGDLGKPVEEVRMKQQQSSGPEAGKPIEDNDDSSSSADDFQPPRRELPRQKNTSQSKEFDRAVAQLTAYGFSPDDARRGLTESGAGVNVQAAANWLLDDAHRKSKEAAKGKGSSPAQREHSASRPAASNRTGESDLAKSAAAMGSSFFKTANSLWKTGQKKMQQAVADFQQEGDSSQPKWMRDAQQSMGSSRESGPKSDNVTNEAIALESGGRPKPTRTSSRQASEGRFASQSSGRASPMSSGPQSRNSPAPPIMDARSRLSRMKADDDDNFSSYVSANRRKKTSSPAAASRPVEPEPDLLFNSEAPSKPAQRIPHRPARAPPAFVKQSQNTPPTSRKSTPKPPRQVPPISSDALQTSTKHRLQGTIHFKRGDYAMAHSSYSSSLTSIPATHPLMIVLLTNRALTALKTGEPKQAVTDADEALKLIGLGNGQGESVDVQGEDGKTEQRDMKDLFGKALTRKAEALEQMEKWADAGAVWQQAVEGGVGGPTAIKGRERCQAALAPKPKAPPKPAAKPRPKPSATASLAPQKSSEAVTRLREANQAAAKEDDEKFELSEAVDQRVNAWHNGNDNLRGLLASLDTVLWENSGWKKVGMHELVMVNKVKITYMKAIAKTHPDKLPQDATTEMRLVAAHVFNILNRNWDKFKTENGL